MTGTKEQLLSGLIGLIIGITCIFGYQSCSKTNSIVIDKKQITETTTRSDTIIVDSLKEELKKTKQDYDKILQDVDSLNASLTALQRLTTKTQGNEVKGVKSDIVVVVKDVSTPSVETQIDKFGYLSSKQTLFLFDNFDKNKVKIGEVSFSGFSDKPWEYKILPKQYFVTTILAETEDGKKLSYNTFEILVDGKKYSLPVTSSILQEKNKDKFYFWNPKLGLSLGTGFSKNIDPTYSGSILFSPMSYGEKKAPTFLFASIGLGFSREATNFVFSPISFNLGKINNITHNTFIEPQFHTNFSGYSFQLGVRVNF